MFLLIISLCLHYDLLSCVNYEKINFNEESLMKQHLQNSFQIKAFIKDARHKFHEEGPVIGRDHELETTKREESLDYKNTNWWWDNSSLMDQLGLSTPQSFLLPMIRSRPTFPFAFTPYTTELNARHLNWDEIFPDHNTSLRSGSKVTSKQSNRSLSQSQFIQSPKDQNYSSFTFQSSVYPNTSLRYHSSQSLGLTTASTTPIEEYMKLWLQEITTLAPVERWMQTLASKIRVTPSYTTNHSTQTSVENRQLKNDSKDQPLRILHQGLPMSDTRADDDIKVRVASAATTTTAPFVIVNVGGILHLRTATVKNERETTMISGRPATIADDADTKVTPTTAGDVPHREHDPESPGPPSKKSRRFNSKARKRSYHHSHKRKKRRHRQKHRCKHPEYSGDDFNQKQEIEYPMLRRMRKTPKSRRRFSSNTQSLKGKKTQKSRAFFSNPVARSFENAKHREPTSQSPSELDDTEDDQLIKFIEVQDKLRTAQKNRISIHRQLKKSFKAAEEKERDKRLRAKAELIRKIAEGSSYSYSDEEATLRKNLIGALQYGNRT